MRWTRWSDYKYAAKGDSRADVGATNTMNRAADETHGFGKKECLYPNKDKCIKKINNNKYAFDSRKDVGDTLSIYDMEISMYPKEFYILPEELFRLGNASSPRLSNVRSRDVDTTVINGITVIIANGKGISVFDREGINQSPMNGWVWRFSPNTRPPEGLKMVNDKPHHYCISPSYNMPVDKFKGLLEEMALKATRVFKKEGQAV